MRVHFMMLVAFLTACSGKPEAEIPDAGKVDNNVYTNDFFSLRLQIPNGWVVQNEDEVKAISEESKNILKQTDPTLELQIDSLEKTTVQMLTVFESEPSDAAEFNASFVVMAEKLPPNVPGIDEKIYLTLAASELRKSGFYLSVSAVPQERKIGNQNFATIKAATKGANDAQAYQEFFVRKSGVYVLIFIASYRTKDQHDVLTEALESVTLE